MENTRGQESLTGNNIESSFESIEIEKWKKYFDRAIVATWLVPLVALLLQLIFTWKQLSFDLNELKNWAGVKEAFSLPLGLFALSVAVSTLIGLNYRSMKMKEQLELTKHQFKLVTKKDNYHLYVEHNKFFKEHVDSLIRGSKLQMKALNDLGDESVIFNYSKLYKCTFPENKTEDMISLTLESKAPIFTLEAPPINFNLIDSLSRESADADLQMKCGFLVSPLYNVGIAVNVNSYALDEGRGKLNLLYADIMRVANMLFSINMMDVKVFEKLRKDIFLLQVKLSR